MIDEVIEDEFFYRYINRFMFSDIMVPEFGFEKCLPKKPAVVNIKQNVNIIHYVVSGKGKLFIDDKEYDIRQGDMFALPLNKKNAYWPDEKEPWHYFWISYFGEKTLQVNELLSVNRNYPVYTVKNSDKMFDIFSRLYFYSKENAYDLDLLATSVFCEIIMLLKKEMNVNKNILRNEKNCVHFIVDYIHHNIQNSNLLKLTEISKQVYLTPNYISHLFTNHTGQSIQNYITTVRLNEACKYLTETDLSIKQIAELCGYPNQLYFSKIFKRRKQYPPSKYREYNRINNRIKETDPDHV